MNHRWFDYGQTILPSSKSHDFNFFKVNGRELQICFFELENTGTAYIVMRENKITVLLQACKLK